MQESRYGQRKLISLERRQQRCQAAADRFAPPVPPRPPGLHPPLAHPLLFEGMTANEFIDLVRRSQLVEEDHLTKALGAVAARNGHRLPEEADPIAATMVESGVLTEWQSDKLLAGKHKGFMLGKYKLLRHLGRVQEYLAEDLEKKRQVTIKIVAGRPKA
jgi:serine/threonine-protein kinase